MLIVSKVKTGHIKKGGSMKEGGDGPPFELTNYPY